MMTTSSEPQHNILIVGDTSENLTVLRQILTAHGYCVRPALNGEMALKTIQTTLPLPDLILLDVMMPPGLNGYEVCQRLKADEQTRDIPVLFLSALDKAANKVKAFEVGGVDYIIKPFHKEEVLARVHTHVTLRNLQQTLQAQNQSLQQLNQELALFSRVSQMFSSSLELEEVLNTVLEEIQRLLEPFSTSLWLVHADMHELVCMKAKGPGSKELVQWSLPIGQGITGWVAQHNESTLVPDTWADNRHFRNIDQQTGVMIRSMLSIPLCVKGKVIGVLNLGSPNTGHFTQNERLMLEPIAVAAAIAIENARLYTLTQQEIAERKRAEAELAKANRELQRLATLDGLTQIANRRQFDDVLQREWRRNAREQSPLALIMADIDHFKRYNDTYGHQMGDDCLKQVARALYDAVKRPGDLVARYGGEEFAMILPQTDAAGAWQIAQTIQKAVQSLQIPHAGSSVDAYVTLSLGVASMIPSPATASEMLITAADQALYHAKDQGRNQIVVKPEEDKTD
jgi:two-component system cell cycle response regulator